jgi:hypothetical protein
MMLDCWNLNPALRPNFPDLAHALRHLEAGNVSLTHLPPRPSAVSVVKNDGKGGYKGSNNKSNLSRLSKGPTKTASGHSDPNNSSSNPRSHDSPSIQHIVTTSGGPLSSPLRLQLNTSGDTIRDATAYNDSQGVSKAQGDPAGAPKARSSHYDAPSSLRVSVQLRDATITDTDADADVMETSDTVAAKSSEPAPSASTVRFSDVDVVALSSSDRKRTGEYVKVRSQYASRTPQKTFI